LQSLVERAVIRSDEGVLPNPLPTAILRELKAGEWPGNAREPGNLMELGGDRAARQVAGGATRGTRQSE
jgi:transcriptional regulator of acetoin/glycerol metabolism